MFGIEKDFQKLMEQVEERHLKNRHKGTPQGHQMLYNTLIHTETL